MLISLPIFQAEMITHKLRIAYSSPVLVFYLTFKNDVTDSGTNIMAWNIKINSYNLSFFFSASAFINLNTAL